jgi:Family of unknown function (DUF6252)
MNTRRFKIAITISYSLLFITSILLQACSQKDRQVTQSNSKGSSASASDNRISFKVNGTQVNSSGWNISRFSMKNGEQLNITSNMHEDTRTISMNIESPKVGTYQLKTGGKSYGNYIPDYENTPAAYSFEKGTIIITSLDTSRNLLNATFEGTVRNNKGEQLVISDGRIVNGMIQPGITTY